MCLCQCNLRYTAPEEKNPTGWDLSDISIAGGQFSLAYTGDEEKQAHVFAYIKWVGQFLYSSSKWLLGPQKLLLKLAP